MKKVLYCIGVLIMASISANAQLGYTKNEVIEEYGTDYKEYWRQGDYCIVYFEAKTDEQCGRYSKVTTIIFNNGLSEQVVINYPSCMANTLMAVLNKQYVREGEDLWRDYSKARVVNIGYFANEVVFTIYYYSPE